MGPRLILVEPGTPFSQRQKRTSGLRFVSRRRFQPLGSNPIWAAANWLEGTLLGSVATAIAVIAVACVGLAMLTGRTDVRRAAHVLFGCFIIFGASTIASGSAV